MRPYVFFPLILMCFVKLFFVFYSFPSVNLKIHLPPPARLPPSQVLTFVAMGTPEDLQANAEFLKKADALIPVPGGPSRENYGSVPLICDLAVKHKARLAFYFNCTINTT